MCGALSPESENHYPLSLPCSDESPVPKQCGGSHPPCPPRARALPPAPLRGSPLRAAVSPRPGRELSWVRPASQGVPGGAAAESQWGSAVPGERPAAAGRCPATRGVGNIWCWSRTDLTRVALSFFPFYFPFFFFFSSSSFSRNYSKAKGIWPFPWLYVLSFHFL